MEEFSFPFTPYDVQLRLMRAMTYGLDEGCVGIFESPTGTGKSLSVVCGVLTWLKNSYDTNQVATPSISTEVINDEPDWLANHSPEDPEDFQVFPNRRPELPPKRKSTAKRSRRKIVSFSRSTPPTVTDSHEAAESDFVIEEIYSQPKDRLDESSSDESDGQESWLKVSKDEDKLKESLKVLYCSRTHSQLTQFINELRETKFGDWVRAVVLAGRNHLCVHEKVSQISSALAMTDACKDLQKRQTSRTHKCEYYGLHQQLSFREAALDQVRDIEEAVEWGKNAQSCPYYGTRRAVPFCDLIALPYASVLHEPTRNSLGIDLRNKILIIDEAHNILNTVFGLHSVNLTARQAQQAVLQLQSYMARYASRLRPETLSKLHQLEYVVRALAKVLETKCCLSKLESVNDFCFACKIDNVNLSELKKFVVESKLPQKLRGFVQSTAISSGEQSGEAGAMYAIVAMFSALSHSDHDGKIVRFCPTCRDGHSSTHSTTLRFVLLNAAEHLRPLLQARAVFFLGGTMAPDTELHTALLRSGMSEERLIKFSCGHVVSHENICVGIVDSTDSTKLTFDYNTRGNKAVMGGLGQLLLEASLAVPDGIVVFFCSYAYEQDVFREWESTGLLEQLGHRKRVFREKRGSTVDTFSMYRDHLDKCRSGCEEGIGSAGAILSSVVGGKLSEGINFKDSLGRLVVMVGLPFPNPNDPELQERMRFVAGNSSSANSSEDSSQQFLENICMRAVNQSIGRCIRHQNDYGFVLLVDSRYHRPSVRSKLPAWIQPSVKPLQWQAITPALHSFFDSFQEAVPNQ